METGRERECENAVKENKLVLLPSVLSLMYQRQRENLINFVAFATLGVQTMKSSLYSTKLITFVLKKNGIHQGQHRSMVGSCGTWLNFGWCRARISESIILLIVFQWRVPSSADHTQSHACGVLQEVGLRGSPRLGGERGDPPGGLQGTS